MSDRVKAITERLTDVLNPHSLQVVDESHLHVGHAGALTGKGHFRVKIVAQAFENRSLLERHRLVYRALGDLMDTDIHALAIEARSAEGAS